MQVCRNLHAVKRLLGLGQATGTGGDGKQSVPVPFGSEERAKAQRREREIQVYACLCMHGSTTAGMHWIHYTYNEDEQATACHCQTFDKPAERLQRG